MNNNGKTSFYNLMLEKNIVIPIIQRDYVQGKDSVKIDSIRKQLIKDMLDALCKSDKEIDFQYIYGIDKEGDVFLPIDGQQRLTSMYLLSWYLSILDSEQNGVKQFCKLKKFTYQVRTTSEEFFSALSETVEDTNGEKKLEHLDDFLSYTKDNTKKLSDFSWFKSKWMSDQTVRSALVFLDSVRDMLPENINVTENINVSELINRLFDPEHCPFKFFRITQNENLDRTKLSEKAKQDEAFNAENRAATTYINMNARGKVLNDFENLKALLHKCTSENGGVKNEVGKKFLAEYEKSYIHIFFEHISLVYKNDSNISFASLVSKMDMMVLNLLLYIYNDLNSMCANSNTKEIEDVYEFMNRIKEKNFNCNEIFPDDYFDFINYIMKSMIRDNNDSQPYFDTDMILYNYCMKHTKKDRWNLFVKYWSMYRLGDKTEGWERFCCHLCIGEDEKDSHVHENWYGTDRRNCLNNILSEIVQSKKNVQNFLCDVDVSEFLKNVCGKDYGESSINLTYARILEEKIKANILCKLNEEDIEKLETIGEKRHHQIRYLLYLAGYYNAEGDYNAEGNYEKLIKYAEMDQYVNPHNSKAEELLWKKVFYISGVDLTSEPIVPPKNISKWNDYEIIYWQSKSIPRYELDRVKNIFDILLKNGYSVADMVEAYKQNYTDISLWLYYLLNRDIKELLEEYILVDKTTNSYRLTGENYYEYILKKDLETRQYESLNKTIKVYSIPNLNPVKPRNGDGYSNRRNPQISIIAVYKEVPLNNTVKKGNVLYKFQFKEFDRTGNHEDQFLWQSDTEFVDKIEGEYITIKELISDKVKELSSDEDALYNLIFKNNTDGLGEKMSEIKDMPDGWNIIELIRSGSNDVRIKIQCSKQPFNSNNAQEIKTHSEILDI